MNKLLIALVTVISLVGCGKKKKRLKPPRRQRPPQQLLYLPIPRLQQANTATATASPAK